jgi:hypothetical protein
MAGLLDRDPSVAYRGGLLPYLVRTVTDPGDDITEYEQLEWASPGLLYDPMRNMARTGAMLTGAGPVDEGVVTQTMLDAPLIGGLLSGATGAVPRGAVLGANVWHGGPNRWMPEPGFPQGRPRLDRVGTGEGAQAYGHGFYSAEAKGVAQDYERRLTGGFDDAEFWPKALDIDMDRNEYDFLKSIAQISIKDPDVVTRDFTSTFPQWQKRQGVRKASATEELHDLATEMIAAKKEGSLKKLDIPDEDIVKFLDWDAPLSEQPESVRAALKGVEYLHGAKHSFEGESLLDEIQYIRDAVKSDPRGEFLHGALESVLGERGTSEYLEKLGIPGLKYYDQMSRGGKEGTRNYVVWDQDVLDRTKVYAQGGFVEKPVFRGVGHFMKNPVQSLVMGA